MVAPLPTMQTGPVTPNPPRGGSFWGGWVSGFWKVEGGGDSIYIGLIALDRMLVKSPKRRRQQRRDNMILATCIYFTALLPGVWRS